MTHLPPAEALFTRTFHITLAAVAFFVILSYVLTHG